MQKDLVVDSVKGSAHIPQTQQRYLLTVRSVENVGQYLQQGRLCGMTLTVSGLNSRHQVRLNQMRLDLLSV
jgi:hypothetical protein